MAELANYTFIPWMRQGLAGKITAADTLGQSEGVSLERASLNIELIVEDTAKDDGSKNETIIARKVNVTGPGDITGISSRAIVRTEPVANITNFEANNLAYLEFYEEDFPWRYTPANPGSDPASIKKLRPWLALIALKDDEFTFQSGTEGLSYITIIEGVVNEVLPDHRDTWCWAHVHFNQKLSETSGINLINEVSNELDADPDVAVSRLICPRKLVPKTHYTVFLIPAFETGRRAGLEGDPSGIQAQAPAWQKGSMPHSEFRPFDFPVYYSWKFATGALGDFESLVSVLKPVITGPEAGKMPMDIQNPGLGLDGMSGTKELGFEGALKPPDFVPDSFPANLEDSSFVKQLRTILNLTSDLTAHDSSGNNLADHVNNPFFSARVVDDPIVLPPTYAIWQAAIRKLGIPGNPAWIEQLNSDPRHRGSAGLGTKAVKDDQENLMQQAWEQIGRINEVNQKIRESEFAKQVSRKLYNKHLQVKNPDRFISTTAPFHKLVTNDSTETSRMTVNQQFKESRIPTAVRAAAFKKLTRPENKKNRKSTTDAKTLQKNIFLNFNKDETETGHSSAALLKKAPANSLGTSTVDSIIQSAITQYQSDEKLQVREALFKLIEDLNQSSFNRTAMLSAADNPAVGATTIRNQVKDIINEITNYELAPDGFITVTVGKDKYIEIFGEASTSKTYNLVRIRRPDETEENKSVSAALSINELQTYQQSFGQLNNVQSLLQNPALKPKIGSINSITNNLKVKLDPVRNLDRKIARQVKIWFNGGLQPLEKLKPVMAYPEFPQATYSYLKKISQDFILPNVSKLPNDSITILFTNQSFVEAFLAGMNHEMSRELLWREFPTDQRGSYFRQFWDVKDNLGPEDDENRKDIRKMPAWNGNLGTNSMRSGTAGTGNLVLVVKGQLLHKYPNTMVYAQKAQYDPTDPTEPRKLPSDINADIMYPIFSAELEPDITLFGFSLTEETARGDRVEDPATNTSTLNPGWFFVFKERPGQIKFGLDDFTGPTGETDVMPAGNPETWNDLSWEHLVNDREELKNFQVNPGKNISVNSPPAGEPNPVWGDNSADMASILYQNPVIFARHAGEMLPES